ncbi:hypothetical protein LINPERHAP2_LOCUS21261 [Linum perenne]
MQVPSPNRIAAPILGTIIVAVAVVLREGVSTDLTRQCKLVETNANPVKLVNRIKKVHDEVTELKHQCYELLAAKQVPSFF